MAGDRASSIAAMVEATAMRIVLLGEQATGKSSMLVALYGALLHRRAGEMRIVRTDEDVEFLSRGLEALGRFESVRRTEADADARVALAVSHSSGTVTIEMPDRSGDQVRNMIDTRLWDPQLQRHVVAADAAMLFLRADWLLDDVASSAHSDPFEHPLDADFDDAAPEPAEQLGAAVVANDGVFTWSTEVEEDSTQLRSTGRTTCPTTHRATRSCGRGTPAASRRATSSLVRTARTMTRRRCRRASP